MSTSVATTEVPRSKTLDKYAAAINAAHEKTVAMVFEIASNLRLARDELSHPGDKNEGKFMAWVDGNCVFTHRTATRYLLILKAFDGQPMDIVSTGFDLSALHFLAKDTTPEDAIDDAIKAAESGDRITLAKARELTEKYTADAESVEEVDEPDEWDLFPCIKKLNRYALTLYERWPKQDIAAMVGKLRSIADEIEAGSFQGGEFIDDDVD